MRPTSSGLAARNGRATGTICASDREHTPPPVVDEHAGAGEWEAPGDTPPPVVDEQLELSAAAAKACGTRSSDWDRFHFLQSLRRVRHRCKNRVVAQKFPEKRHTSED